MKMIIKFLKNLHKFFLSNELFQNFILKSFTKIVLNKKILEIIIQKL